jgi:RNA polymerase sigma-70 factor (ECF subfamily)
VGRATPRRVVDAIARLRRAGVPADGALGAEEAEALAAIYDAYAGPMRTVARRLVGHDEAADVVHDVFCRLPLTIARYRDGQFGGWLKRCVIRAALMRLRTGRRRQALAARNAGAFDDGAGAAAAVRLREMCDEVWWALERLPESLRRVVLLRVVDEATHAEIAARLGITLAASEVRLCRAVKRLRALLHADGRHTLQARREVDGARVRPEPARVSRSSRRQRDSYAQTSGASA